MNDSPAKPGLLARYGTPLKWLFALGLLGTLFYLNRETFRGLSLEAVRWEFAAIAFALCGGSILLTFVRWYLLVWAQEFDFSLKSAIQLGFLGYVSNYIAPGAVGGDAVKAVMIAREQPARRAVAVATIILDRILGLLALFLVGAGVWLLQSEATRTNVFRTVAAVFAIGSAAGLLGLVLALHTPALRAGWLRRLVQVRFVGKLIGEMVTAVGVYQSRARVLWLAVAISIVGHLMMLSGFYFCALAVNPSEAVPDYFAHLLFMPAAEIAGMIPLFPGGVGALEGAIAKFYEAAGYSDGNGLLTGLGFRCVSILIAALGAGYYFSAKRRIRESVAGEAAGGRGIRKNSDEPRSTTNPE